MQALISALNLKNFKLLNLSKKLQSFVDIFILQKKMYRAVTNIAKIYKKFAIKYFI